MDEHSKLRFRLHDARGGAALTVRVTPRARRTEVAGVREDGTLKIRLAAPPVEGKANQALIKFLAGLLGVRRQSIEIVAGHTGLDKIISITDLSAAEVEQRIRRHVRAAEDTDS